MNSSRDGNLRLCSSQEATIGLKSAPNFSAYAFRIAAYQAPEKLVSEINFGLDLAESGVLAGPSSRGVIMRHGRGRS